MITKRTLKDMNLEELWKLFPIILTPHQPRWKEWATSEISNLSSLLEDYFPVITHIGSTAIPEILAKPIIDLLVEIQVKYDWTSLQTKMENAEYICMSVSDNRMSFNKGYTPDGFADRVFHIHVREKGDNDEIYFRDYLIKNPEVAHEYELLKSSLLPEFKNNRDSYTAAKTEFVNRIMKLAKQTL